MKIEKLAENDIPLQYERDLFVLGLNSFLTDTLDFCSALLLAAVFNRFADSVLYILSFAILRPYTGGYHAETQMKCLLTYIGVYLLYIGITSLIHDPIIYHIILISGSIYTWANAPAEHIYNPLQDDERIANQYKARIITVLLVLIYYLCLHIHLYIFKTAALVIGINACSMFALKCTDKWRKQ